VLALIGDIHGEFGRLPKILSQIPKDAIILQVGDFGWWPGLQPVYLRARAAVGYDFHIRFIEGNHDHVRLVGECNKAAEESTESWRDWPGAEYVPRGSVLELDGKRILFMGGANSLDRRWRPHNFGPHAWFDEEEVTEEDVMRAVANVIEGDEDDSRGIDLIVAHTPPDSVIRSNFSEDGLRMFDIDPRKWVDRSARNVEALWRSLGKPPLWCGHMHRSVVDGPVRILGINEVGFFDG